MGIDFLDIIYRVEKTFGIRFVREEFDFSQGRYLVGDFYDLVERKVCAAAKDILETPDYRGKILNEVKRALSEELDVEDDWTEETTLGRIYEQIPETERKKTWKQFRTQAPTDSNVNVARIVDEKSNRSLKAVWIGYIAFLLVISLIFLNPLVNRGNGVVSFAGFVLVAAPSLIFWIKYNDYRCYMSVPQLTLGEIVDSVIEQRRQSLKKDGSPYTREEIEEGVKAALCEALAVKPKDVTPEKDLVRDLGME